MTQQMNELNSGKIKITNDGNIIMQFSNYHHVIDSDTELYYKHQADKVIAELEEKLKVQTSIAEEGWKESGTYHTSYAEAVKELYDKNKEIAERKEKYNELAKLHDKAIQACCDADKVIAHQKYKRCRAIAEWCERKRIDAADYRIPRKKWEFYDRWRKRWLKLAEKFKEAK